MSKKIIYQLNKTSDDKLDLIIRLLKEALGKEDKVMDDFKELQDQVAENETVEASAVLLIQGIAARIAAAGIDPVELDRLTASLNTSATSLAAVVAANTPATPPPAA
jgi:hypothetical protein